MPLLQNPPPNLQTRGREIVLLRLYAAYIEPDEDLWREMVCAGSVAEEGGDGEGDGRIIKAMEGVKYRGKGVIKGCRGLK